MLQIIFRQKIGEQFAILKHRINRLPQKPCVTADRPNRVPIGGLIRPHLKIFKLGHGEQNSPQSRKEHKEIFGGEKEGRGEDSLQRQRGH